MSNPIIINTEKVFDFHSCNDKDGSSLKHGIYIHQRRYKNKNYVGDWVFASRNENPTEVLANAVMIVARVDDRILIADEFRIPLANREYGFPAGLCEPEQSFEANAVRELREESGLHATYVYPQLTSGTLISSAGLSDEAAKIVFIEAEGEISHHLCEPSESIHAELMDYNQVMDVFHQSRTQKDYFIGAKTYGIMFGWWLSGHLDFSPAGLVAHSPDECVPVTWMNKNTPQESFVIG